MSLRSLLAWLLGASPAQIPPPSPAWATFPLPDGEPLLVWSAGRFEPPLSDLIRRAKYGRSWHSALTLSRVCAKTSGSWIWSHHPILIPIPSDPRRLPTRGFHLPLLIAQALSTQRECPLRRRGLTKPRSSEVQAGRSRGDRLRALSGLFEASASLSGKCVLLVDDVFTTGATLSAARQALNAVGAQVLGAVVAARVATPRETRTGPAKIDRCRPRPKPQSKLSW